MPDQVADQDYTTRGTLKVKEPTALPDVVDVFVAGGGPAGTAAAVRAKELGLSCLVVDYDDLLKRIRDYPKEKLIKPSYGGGDKLQFPAGGPMLAALHFDDIDKDEMVAAWKATYKECGLGARIGSEFTGLERGADGVWEVRTWNHRSGEEMRYRARNVMIAIGAGVPRRFDIPGNTDGIAFRLDDAKHYVGAPALVIGGGTSAAEAVIAISNAKVAAEDESAVYWSYRGASMPKVSKALSEMFFNAYVGNGNIKYLSFSEPVAVVVGPDKLEYLSVRIDRKLAEGRPPETVHLEFPKEHVVACIGEDLPVRLLQGVGIKVPLVNNRPLMLVSRDGETSLPGVFLVGDARGPKYLRCTDFDDSSTYEQVVEKRNIKAAMVDAVRVVEAVAARAGQVLPKAAPAPATPAKGKPVPARAKTAAAGAAQEAPAAAAAVVPPTPSEPADARQAPTEVQLVSLHPDDTQEEQFPVTAASVTIGRGEADIRCADDVYMAELHAVVSEREGGWVLEDRSGDSGVWMRAKGTVGRPVAEGDLVWIGSQILRAARIDGRFAVEHYDGDGVFRKSHPIGDKGLFVGRASEAELDRSDLSLSRRHAQFRVGRDGLAVYDLGSKNGTWVKITQPIRLQSGDEFRIASKRFRFEHFAAVSKLAASDVVVEAPPEPPPDLGAPPKEAPAAAAAPAAKAAAGAVAAGAFAVEIQHAEHPVTFGVTPGQDILHAYFESVKARFPGCKVSAKGEPTEHMDEPLGWECKVGLCGLCAIEIVEGAEQFVAVDRGSPEMNTIENKAFLDADPKKYRLACLAKIQGPVKLTMPS